MASLGFRCGKGTIRQYECGENYFVLNQGEGVNFPDITCKDSFYVRICNKGGCDCETLEIKAKVGDRLYFSCLQDIKICKEQEVIYYDFKVNCEEKVRCTDEIKECNSCGEFKDKKRSYLRGALENILKGKNRDGN